MLLAPGRIGRIGVTQAEGFVSPLHTLLFGNGEDGFLFGNFAEPDELFLLSTGNTGNVAANDEPVGLALDDSKWGGSTLAQIVAAASELVTNGQFGVDASGWTANGSTLAAVAGQLEINSTAGGFNARAVQSIATVAGTTYRLSVDSITVGNAIRIGTTSAGVDIFPNTPINAVNGYTVYFVAQGATTWLGLVGSTVLNAKNYFDNVSIKAIPGRHALQATAANRPFWKANAGKPYLSLDGLNDSLIPPFYPLASGTGLSMAAAFNANVAAAANCVIGGGTPTGDKRAMIGLTGAGSLSVGWGTEIAETVPVDRRNANHVLLMTGDASGRDVWFDGQNVTSLFAASVGMPDGTGGALTLGGRQNTVGGGPDRLFTGNIPAALAVNRRVTPTEIARITSDFQRTF